VWWWLIGKRETLPTIWEVPDDLWEQLPPVIVEMDPPKAMGRKGVHPRRILDGIIFWEAQRPPLEPAVPGTGGRQHHPFPALELGVEERVWALLVEECEELGAVEWEFADWAKAGSKRSILVDGVGRPLSAEVAGANVHDTKLLVPTLAQ